MYFHLMSFFNIIDFSLQFYNQLLAMHILFLSVHYPESTRGRKRKAHRYYSYTIYQP